MRHLFWKTRRLVVPLVDALLTIDWVHWQCESSEIPFNDNPFNMLSAKTHTHTTFNPNLNHNHLATSLSLAAFAMSKWKIKYPQVGSCLDACVKMVEMPREHPDAELEARLGVVDALGKFHSGVPRSDVDRIIAMMKSSAYMTGTEWKEEQDFFFSDANSRAKCRTRVHYNTDKMEVNTMTVEKKTLSTLTIRVLDEDGARQGVDMRVSLNVELPVLHVPPCVTTDFVRIKQRSRFVTECSCWAFDFSIVWSGADKTSAEMAQSTCDPTYEVECELIDASKLLAIQEDDRIACSLLLKMCDLLRHQRCRLVTP